MICGQPYAPCDDLPSGRLLKKGDDRYRGAIEMYSGFLPHTASKAFSSAWIPVSALEVRVALPIPSWMETSTVTPLGAKERRYACTFLAVVNGSWSGTRRQVSFAIASLE